MAELKAPAIDAVEHDKVFGVRKVSPFLDNSAGGLVRASADVDGLQYVSVISRYFISHIDSAGSPAYYGFLDKAGNWYIMKESAGAWTYSAGTSGYATAWTGRSGLSYDTYDNIF